MKNLKKLFPYLFLTFHLCPDSPPVTPPPAPPSTDQHSTAGGDGTPGSADLNSTEQDSTKILDALNKLTAENAAMRKELEEVKKANLDLVTRFTPSDGENKSFDDAFRMLFDYGQKRGDK